MAAAPGMEGALVGAAEAGATWGSSIRGGAAGGAMTNGAVTAGGGAGVVAGGVGAGALGAGADMMGAAAGAAGRLPGRTLAHDASRPAHSIPMQASATMRARCGAAVGEGIRSDDEWRWIGTKRTRRVRWEARKLFARGAAHYMLWPHRWVTCGM
jgi:hypothetical protein